MEELISLGCKVTLANKVGRTALHFAAQTNNHIAANTLIKHGAKVDAPDNQVRQKSSYIDVLYSVFSAGYFKY